MSVRSRQSGLPRTGSCLCVVLVALFLVSPAMAQSVERTEEPICQFCKTPQDDQNYFCTRCGRLFRIASLEPANRFWGDAFYIFNLPTLTTRPKLTAELSATGLVQESATFSIGDRYEYKSSGKGTKGAKGATVTGRIRAWGTSKEVGYLANVEETFDEDGKLQRREVRGEVRAKPKRFFYRKIEFEYDSSRLKAADVASWLYTKSNDWQKSPAEWIRHSAVAISLEYSDGELSRICPTTITSPPWTTPTLPHR